jgi:hypothetical protein
MTATLAHAQKEVAPLHRLPDQLWVDWTGGAGAPSPARMRPPSDDVAGRPHGGLWTSTFRPATADSAFIEAMREQLRGVATVQCTAWVLTPDPARIWMIRDAMAQLDLRVLADDSGPLWPQVARHVDGAHMTHQGARAYLRPPVDDGRHDLHMIRLHAARYISDQHLGHPLDWWYSESTYWAHWAFGAVQRVDDILMPARPKGIAV